MLCSRLISRLFLGGRGLSSGIVPRQAEWWLFDLLGQDGGDPGHWNYVRQWVGGQGGLMDADFGKTVFRHQSKFNGLVEVTSHPCSDLTLLGQNNSVDEEWRVLRFNHITRQSCARVYLEKNGVKARPECLAQDYLQSMAAVAAGFYGVQMSFLSSPRVLFVGLGGGSLPLFFSHHFPRWSMDAIEIDPVVWEAATQVMGFPLHLPNLCVHVEDAFDFLRRHHAEGRESYDMIIVDAFNGENDSPDHLKGAEFAAALAPCLHPKWGTVLLNLHSREGQGPALHFKNHFDMPSHDSICYTIGTLRMSNRTLVYARGLADSVVTRRKLEQAAVKVADEASFCFNVKPRVSCRPQTC